MLKKENRYDEYAYRFATLPLDPSVKTLEEGQWLTLKDGKLVVSDGKSKSFMTIASKRKGRDMITGMTVKQAAVLVGHFIVSTSNFDPSGEYKDLTPLKVKEGGIVTPWKQESDKANEIVAYSLGAPHSGFLRIMANA